MTSKKSIYDYTEYANLITPREIKKEIDFHKNHVTNSKFAIGFIERSIELANKTVTCAKHIPLDDDYVNFDTLSNAQTDWYIYWRGEFCDGNCLETSKGYIVLLAQELIHYSFRIDASFNVQNLVRIYMTYNHCPELRLPYLNFWIADMLFEIGANELGEKWLEVGEKDNPDQELLSLLEVSEFSQIPFHFYKKYIKHSRRSNLTSEDQSLLEEAFIESVKTYEEVTNLKQRWLARVSVEYHRFFRFCMLERRIVKPREKLCVVVIKSSSVMYEDLNSFYKLAEVIVKRKNGLRGIWKSNTAERELVRDNLFKKYDLIVSDNTKKSKKGSVSPTGGGLTVDELNKKPFVLDKGKTVKLSDQVDQFSALYTEMYSDDNEDEKMNVMESQINPVLEEPFQLGRNEGERFLIISSQEKKLIDCLVKEKNTSSLLEELELDRSELSFLINSFNQKIYGELGDNLIIKSGTNYILDEEIYEEMISEEGLL